MIGKKFNGERIKTARLFNGWTLKDLSEKSMVSKQAISLYENNKMTPEYDKIFVLSRVLNFPIDFFFQEDKIKTATETTYFRSLVSSTKKARTAQTKKLEKVAELYSILWKYIEFPAFNRPGISFEGYDDDYALEEPDAVVAMEEVATMARRAWGIGLGPIVNLQYLLEKNGILVTGFETMEDKIDAFSQNTQVGADEVFLVALDLGRHPLCRLRFDMAHELAHILLHPWGESIESLGREEFNIREKQANMFASAFLLPDSTFGQVVRNYGGYRTNLSFYQSLKDEWQVSIQAMLYRVRQLKIITANQYQYLMRQVSKKGWRTAEPGDSPGELNGNVFQEAVNCLFDNHVFTPESLMEKFKSEGLSLYPEVVETLLHLKEGTLKMQDNGRPILQLRGRGVSVMDKLPDKGSEGE